ncbi:hypothetical protein FDUTEX481_08157 [Tolypothrix sp. PCC 7601]|nr:hypothetical protein FDUTEX481_08157 [Tolypothrix sp. PCC 7601]
MIAKDSYPLPITHYPFPITHSPLPIPHYPFPITTKTLELKALKQIYDINASIKSH